MLVLSRKEGESILIDGQISVSIVSIRKGACKLGISAPRDVTVHRAEIAKAIATQNNVEVYVKVPLKLLRELRENCCKKAVFEAVSKLLVTEDSTHDNLSAI